MQQYFRGSAPWDEPEHLQQFPAIREEPKMLLLGCAIVLYGKTTHGLIVQKLQLINAADKTSMTMLAAGIPQQVRLTLDIELLDMQKEDVFKAIDADSDRYLTLKEVENWIRENPQVNSASILVSIFQ